MTTDREQLQIQMNRLTVQMPRLQRECPDPADFWPAFAGIADSVVDAAGPEDFDWVVTQIDAILNRNGLLARQ